MIKDIIFILLVLTAAVYAHSYKSTIVNFIVNESEEDESETIEELVLKHSSSSLVK